MFLLHTTTVPIPHIVGGMLGWLTLSIISITGFHVLSDWRYLFLGFFFNNSRNNHIYSVDLINIKTISISLLRLALQNREQQCMIKNCDEKDKQSSFCSGCKANLNNDIEIVFIFIRSTE